MTKPESNEDDQYIRQHLEELLNLAIAISIPENFPDFISKKIKSIRYELEEINNNSINFVATNEIKTISETINDYIKFIERIEKINIEKLDPLEKLSILEESSKFSSKIFSQTSPFNQMAKVLASDIVSNKIDSNLEITEKILASAKQLSTNELTKKQSKFFQDEADKHSTQSIQWKNYSIALLIITCTLAVAGIAMAFCPQLHPKDTYQLIQIVTGKIILIAISIYTLGVCIKNYQAHKHNEILNSHRENALSAASALIDLIEEPNQKDAVLLQVANVVFSIQDTGYTKPTSSEVDVMKSVVDLLAKQIAKDK
ncbi:hypothetical protein [Aquitalea sp. ASV15]|uniref:hypothetical protein n=1 Tax=Aquitalea sp. ASV15 TaxID=2795104 RepID=UPI0018EC5BD7|nr:hypothetical protein [Aquitalea sp. ASV15]